MTSLVRINSWCSYFWYFILVIFDTYVKLLFEMRRNHSLKNACRLLDKFTAGLSIQGKLNTKSVSLNGNIKALMLFLSCPRSMPWHRILCHILVSAHWAIIQFVQQAEWSTLSAFRVRVMSRITYGSFSIQPSCPKWFKLVSEGKIWGPMWAIMRCPLHSSGFFLLVLKELLEHSGPGMRRNT